MMNFLFFSTKNIDTEAIKGKTKDEIVRLYGKPDFTQEMIYVYIVDRSVWNPKGFAVVISFNDDGFCKAIVRVRND